MSDKPETTATSAKNKKPIQILRERRGGVPRELVQRNRRQKAIRQSIVAVLQEESKTIPELARRVELPADEVFWHVMGMKKYGQVAEAEQVDGYFKYALIDESRQTETTS